jgi:hypothetical protein
MVTLRYVCLGEVRLGCVWLRLWKLIFIIDRDATLSGGFPATSHWVLRFVFASSTVLMLDAFPFSTILCPVEDNDRFDRRRNDRRLSAGVSSFGVN